MDSAQGQDFTAGPEVVGIVSMQQVSSSRPGAIGLVGASKQKGQRDRKGSTHWRLRQKTQT